MNLLYIFSKQRVPFNFDSHFAQTTHELQTNESTRILSLKLELKSKCLETVLNQSERTRISEEIINQTDANCTTVST